MEHALAETELRTYLDARDWRAAGTWLVHRHTHAVIGLCRAMIRDRAAAEDIAQEVFGRAFSRLHTFRGEASSLSWLLSIARNRCIDYLRARGRDPSLGWRDDSAEPDTHPDSAPLPPDLISRRRQVQSALESLAEVDRALVVLRFRHGLDYRELAKVFGQREGALRMRVNRALARMRSLLERAEPEQVAPAPRRSVRERRPPPPAGPAEIGQPAFDDLEAPEQAQGPAPAPRPGSRGYGPPAGGRPAPARPRHSPPPAPSSLVERPSRGHPLSEVLATLDPGVPSSLEHSLLAMSASL